jgi:hypothetical protein
MIRDTGEYLIDNSDKVCNFDQWLSFAAWAFAKSNDSDKDWIRQELLTYSNSRIDNIELSTRILNKIISQENDNG